MGTRGDLEIVTRLAEAAPINLTDRSVSPATDSPFVSQAAYDVVILDPPWPAPWAVRAGSTRTGPVIIHGVDPGPTAWFDASVTGMTHVLGLARGWDSYDARPVARRSAQSALTFLARFVEATTAPPAVVPLSDGGVQLEWHRGGLDVEIAFSPDEEPEMYVADHETGDTWDIDPSSADFEEVRPLLTRLRAE
jgi:hypothetical protein